MTLRTISILLLLLAAAAGATAQTRLISHKGHSGGGESYRTDGAGNYGLGDFESMPRVIRKVVRLSDTTAIEVTNRGSDTVHNSPYWNNPGIRVDSLRRQFPQISFEGYDEVDEASLHDGENATAGFVVSELDRKRYYAVLGVTTMLVAAGGFYRRRNRTDA